MNEEEKEEKKEEEEKKERREEEERENEPLSLYSHLRSATANFALTQCMPTLVYFIVHSNWILWT
jgi:hypothetical protein